MLDDIHRSGAIRIIEAGLRIEKKGGPGRLERGLEEPSRIRRRGGHNNIKAWRVGESRFHRLRVKRAHPRPVASAGRHDNHWCAPSPDTAPKQTAKLAMDLVEGQWQKVSELDESNRPPSGQRTSDRDPDDQRLAQRRIDHTARIGGREPARDAKDIPLGILDILAEQRDARVDFQTVPVSTP